MPFDGLTGSRLWLDASSKSSGRIGRCGKSRVAWDLSRGVTMARRPRGAAPVVTHPTSRMRVGAWRCVCSPEMQSHSREEAMPHKHLLFRSEAREKVLRGAAAIADAVRVTLGAAIAVCLD